MRGYGRRTTHEGEATNTSTRNEHHIFFPTFLPLLKQLTISAVCLFSKALFTTCRDATTSNQLPSPIFIVARHEKKISFLVLANHARANEEERPLATPR